MRSRIKDSYTDFIKVGVVLNKLSNDIPTGILSAIWKQAQLGDKP